MKIEGYTIIEPLARGGAAQIYLAEQLSIGRHVAVKVLDARIHQDPELVPRFQREAKVIASLQHPNIVPILDYGTTADGYPFYAMPWLKTDLASFDLHQDEGEIRRVIGELCDGLSYAHQRDVIHRDIKPANVFVSDEGTARLGDFGLALMTRSNATRLTEEGITVGTAEYMSPEQALAGSMDLRTDVYSLGVVCFELLTGATPFTGKDAVSVAAAHIEAPIPKLPEAWTAWQAWMEHALAKQPSGRFKDMSAMKYAMPGMPPPTVTISHADKQPRTVASRANISGGPVKGWMLAALAALIVAMVVMAIVVLV